MTPLRERMLHDMQIRNLAAKGSSTGAGVIERWLVRPSRQVSSGSTRRHPARISPPCVQRLRWNGVAPVSANRLSCSRLRSRHVVPQMPRLAPCPDRRTRPRALRRPARRPVQVVTNFRVLLGGEWEPSKSGVRVVMDLGQGCRQLQALPGRLELLDEFAGSREQHAVAGVDQRMADR